MNELAFYKATQMHFYYKVDLANIYKLKRDNVMDSDRTLQAFLQASLDLALISTCLTWPLNTEAALK